MKQGKKIQSSKRKIEKSLAASIPEEIREEQKILDILQKSFSGVFGSDEFELVLRNIKKAFYERDFNTVFTNSENLPVYSAAYAPRRALCYYNLLRQIPEISNLLCLKNKTIYCLGAGAGSELLGISSLINELVEQNSVKKENVNTSIVLQDYVDWNSVLIPLQETIMSEYNFSAGFVDFKHDLSNLLEIDAQIETGISKADLVTCMFVFNELFADKAKVMQFISLLTNKLQPGKLFLVTPTFSITIQYDPILLLILSYIKN
ncbi:25S rRNA [Smittium culicis]|uniref:25S rRNA n=1 Tax=Smittium culicis TaxID=133412 RepID=A0A1R1YBG5_9FUNG|nr:25S rRNA [Smittium culicis]